MHWPMDVARTQLGGSLRLRSRARRWRRQSRDADIVGRIILNLRLSGLDRQPDQIGSGLDCKLGSYGAS